MNLTAEQRNRFRSAIIECTGLNLVIPDDDILEAQSNGYTINVGSYFDGSGFFKPTGNPDLFCWLTRRKISTGETGSMFQMHFGNICALYLVTTPVDQWQQLPAN